MEHFAEFQGPTADDYANVRALNAAFLKATSALNNAQQQRLVSTPFLLFSVREQDLSWWDRAVAENGQADLMDEPDLENPLLRQLQFAVLSFLWHLGRRNAYAARVITGASVAWCERIAELPLVTLLNRIGSRSDLITSRLDDTGTLGDHLMVGAGSAVDNVRRSSRYTALQVLLTSTGAVLYSPLASAACDLSGPARTLKKKV